MQYRRALVKGGTYFFTVNLAERHRKLLTEHVDLLRAAIKKVKQSHSFHIDAFVVLPDHLHAIWTLPEGDSDFSKRWMLIKANFSRNLPLHEKRSVSRIKKRERGIWQRRFWEHLIRNDEDYRKHIDYIHYNPVKHGYTNRASDWPFSSIHRYIREGVFDSCWGDESIHEGEYGE